jgi:[ribosomal protein S5]-alanine N-acetyltransferase
MTTYLPRKHSSGGPVYLRPLQEEDFTERYLEWFRDPEVTRFLDARNITREDTIQNLRNGQKENTWYLFAICETATNRHIGNLKIGPIHWRHSTSDLVTVLGERDSWGKGYAREAIKLGIEIACKELNIRKLSASIDSLNIGSIKAYTAAGFTVETSLKDQFMDVSSGTPVLSGKVFVAYFNPTFAIKR